MWDSVLDCCVKKSRYLEEDDEGQPCCQDAPVMLGECVCIGGPGRLSVVFVPTQDQKHLESELPFLRLDVSNCPGAMNQQQLTTIVLGAKPGTDTTSAGDLASRASRKASREASREAWWTRSSLMCSPKKDLINLQCWRLEGKS